MVSEDSVTVPDYSEYGMVVNEPGVVVEFSNSTLTK